MRFQTELRQTRQASTRIRERKREVRVAAQREAEPREDRVRHGDRWKLETTGPPRRGPRASKAQDMHPAIEFQPTLGRAWPRENPGPQCAFKISMFNVSCNSH